MKSFLLNNALSLSFLALIAPFGINADEYHYNNMLIGDRASGLAGAYVSISDDPSGLYYNPAGIVYSVSSNISANMNAYNYTRVEYKNALGGESWIRDSAGLVPNFFGITQPLGPGMLGFSYAVTDYALEDQDQTFSDIPSAGTKFTINFNNQDTTNNIGPSYAVPIGNNISIGLTLYGFMRTQEQIFNQSFEFTDKTKIIDENTSETKTVDHFHVENLYITRKEYGIKPILGLMYSPAPSLSLGISFTKVFLLHTAYDDQYTIVSNFCRDDSGAATICDDANFLRSTSQANVNRDMPWQINAGGTWFVNNKLLLTGSAWVYEAIHDTTQPLVNVAGGLEYYLTGKWAIRMGGYTDLSNTPKLKAGAINIYNEHIDIVGATMSLSHFTRTSSITFGAAGKYGFGKAQVIGGSATLQDVSYIGLTFFISASNSF